MVISAAAGTRSADATQPDPGDPALPAGRDPGGIPMAWVGWGLDYTAAPIRDRLARDGEGELTGYDLADDDRRPFNARNPLEEKAARVFLAEAPMGSLVILRHGRSDPPTLFGAIGYGVRTPARLTAILAPLRQHATVTAMLQAAQRLPDHLFLTGPFPVPSGAKPPENLIRVSARPDQGTVSAQAHSDLVIAIDDHVDPTTDEELDVAHAAQALARTAALAVRLLAAEPAISAREAKRRILGLAQSADAGAHLPDTPLMADPQRHFRAD